MYHKKISNGTKNVSRKLGGVFFGERWCWKSHKYEYKEGKKDKKKSFNHSKYSLEN